ncbi:BTAD domain-containing putative transcriptional regulator [Streptomyces sp. NPDC003077]|uniref:BTAD domain-containing putative transcriptional regulator n=1 Tax=Streptomyces sp. NPDC003077 TaxID=3154443 RepID=UPI0033A7534F
MSQHRSPSAARSWPRAVLQALLAATALLVVTVGVPYALTAANGTPWPSPAASVGDLVTRLSRPVSDPLVTDLLSLLGWTCWAAFMVTLVREALWMARHLPALRGDATALRTRLRTIPRHRLGAAFLLGALLFALLAAWRPAAAHATPDVTVSHPIAAVATAMSGTELMRQSPRPEDSVTEPYAVQSGDTLWSIARTCLGDPLRWPEIYRLNHDRTQSDGQRLRDPDLLRPGWTLRLPSSGPHTTGTGTVRAPHRTAAASPDRDTASPSPQPPAPTPTTGLSAPHGQANPSPETSGRPTATVLSSLGQDRAVEISVGTASVIGVTTAAGIATAVSFARAHARRRRHPDLSAPAPPPLAEAVKAATRAAHLPTHQDDAESAALDEPDEAGLQRHVPPAEPSAPGTVVCATRKGRELTVDLLAVPGGIALTGPGADSAARALTIAVLSAAERLRPGRPQTRLLMPASTAQRLLPLAPPSLPAWAITRDCAQALSLIEQDLLLRARLAETDEDSQAGDPPMDLLITDLDPPSAERLKGIADQAAPGRLAVIVLGADDWPSRARVATDGAFTATTGPASLRLDDVHMSVLARASAHQLLDTLYAAHGHVTSRATLPSPATAPAPPPHQAPGPLAPQPPQAPERPSGQDANQSLAPCRSESSETEDRGREMPSAPVTVHVLGRFRIRARGKEEEFGHGMRAETREFLALLAAHPKGIRSEEITEALRMSSDPERAGRELANLRRAVRRSLRQATGAHQAAFVVRVGERHLLDKGLVATDIEAFSTAVRAAATASDETARAAALKEAVATYGGPLCEGADYAWADELREAVHRKAVDAVVLLADHTTKSHPDPDQALALLDQAAEWDPFNEAVYQRIIRLQRAAGRDDAAHRTYALLSRRLADLDVTPDSETTALLRQAQPLTAS